MESQSNPLVHEAIEAISREMEFYKELKRRRQAMSIWEPKTELTRQQEIAFQNSTCDPLLRQVAKSILEEIEYNRNQRRRAMYYVYGLFVFIVIALAILAGLLYWQFTKPPKRKYGLKH